MNVVKYGAFCVKILLLVMLLLAMPIVATRPARAQIQMLQEGQAAHRLERAFEDGNARELLDSAVDRLEISLFGTQTSYSRGQALYVMEDFFRNYPPRRFTLQEQQATDGFRFATGRYWYEGGDRPLQVYVRLRAGEGEWVLHEIRIEEQ